ncbi:hypothetical protein DSM112329_03418 [Paraconexibacter sp. AEG42_29]|uniref:MFS transporter n=1 Tax=Paraconexibacter sp. AEG42_29 TaxID=2997339 RepID=A0AAU7AY05_9ACTN
MTEKTTPASPVLRPRMMVGASCGCVAVIIGLTAGALSDARLSASAGIVRDGVTAGWQWAFTCLALVLLAGAAVVAWRCPPHPVEDHALAEPAVER